MEDKRRISFGERVGAVKPPTIMEVETMSEVLSVALWNVIVNSFITDIPESEGYNSWYNTKCASKEIWEYLDLNILEMPDIERNGFIADTTNFIQVLHEKFWNSTESQWHKKFDLVQFLLEIENKYGIQEFSKRINKKLIDHNSGYRVIKNLIVPITNN